MVQDQQLQLLRELEDEDEPTKGKEAKEQTQNQKYQENPLPPPITGPPTPVSPAQIGAPYLSKAMTCLSEVDISALSITLVNLEVIGGLIDEEDEE